MHPRKSNFAYQPNMATPNFLLGREEVLSTSPNSDELDSLVDALSIGPRTKQSSGLHNIYEIADERRRNKSGIKYEGKKNTLSNYGKSKEHGIWKKFKRWKEDHKYGNLEDFVALHGGTDYTSFEDFMASGSIFYTGTSSLPERGLIYKFPKSVIDLMTSILEGGPELWFGDLDDNEIFNSYFPVKAAMVVHLPIQGPGPRLQGIYYRINSILNEGMKPMFLKHEFAEEFQWASTHPTNPFGLSPSYRSAPTFELTIMNLRRSIQETEHAHAEGRSVKYHIVVSVVYPNDDMFAVKPYKSGVDEPTSIHIAFNAELGIPLSEWLDITIDDEVELPPLNQLNLSNLKDLKVPNECDVELNFDSRRQFGPKRINYKVDLTKGGVGWKNLTKLKRYQPLTVREEGSPTSFAHIDGVIITHEDYDDSSSNINRGDKYKKVKTLQHEFHSGLGMRKAINDFGKEFEEEYGRSPWAMDQATSE